MILLLDIGNTHTHLGLGNARGVTRQKNIPTRAWFDATAISIIKRFLPGGSPEFVALCSVVPKATKRAVPALRKLTGIDALELSPQTVRGIGINYPKANTIGADRLANAVAARRRFGAPAVVVDFGTAVTFDVVDRDGDYVGGIIAPGNGYMLRYSVVLLAGCLAAGPAAAASWADRLFDEMSKDFGSVPRGPALVHHFRLVTRP